MRRCFRIDIYDDNVYIFSFYETCLGKLLEELNKILGKTNYNIEIKQVEREF